MPAFGLLPYSVGILVGFYLGHGMGVAKGVRFAYKPLAEDPQLRDMYMRRGGVTSSPEQFAEFVAVSQRPFRFMTVSIDESRKSKQEAEARAVQAQETLLPWYRSLPGASGGIGITCVARTRLPDGSWRMPHFENEWKDCFTGVNVNLRTSHDVTAARGQLGDLYGGVPILYAAVGDIYAQAQ